MKKHYQLFIAGLLACLLLASAFRTTTPDYGLKNGTPSIQSINALSFGPDGILFIGDSKGAAIFAVDTKDKTPVEKQQAIELKNVDQKIAAVLGTQPSAIIIQDIAVNPVSKKLYCAVQSSDGTPVLLTIEGEKIQPVNLKNIEFSTVSINNAPAEDAKDQRGRPLRVWAISDLGYADGKVMVSGLSNQEFSSTFRSIPFPFTNKQDQASLEIYHAAHGRFETYAPIKTFTVAELKGKKYLVASYTCTPLVLFPLEDLKPGTHVKGRTVAEMGAGNSPIDMVTVKNGNDTYLLMANSSRPVMRVKYNAIEAYEGSLTEPVKESYSTAGVDFVNLPVVNVLQLEKIDDTQVVLLQRTSNGDLNLWTASNKQWL